MHPRTPRHTLFPYTTLFRSMHNAGKTSGQIKIVAELPGDGQRDKGYKAAEDALQAHSNLAGIFAINDPSALGARAALEKDRKSTRLNSSHGYISYAVFCLKK